MSTVRDQGGFVAKYSTECARCGDYIERGVDHVVHQRGAYIHTRCASGQDDQ